MGKIREEMGETFKLNVITFSNPLHWFTGLQAVDHMPDTVGCASFDDLQWGGIVKGRVRGFEPFADVGGDRVVIRRTDAWALKYFPHHQRY